MDQVAPTLSALLFSSSFFFLPIFPVQRFLLSNPLRFTLCPFPRRLASVSQTHPDHHSFVRSVIHSAIRSFIHSRQRLRHIEAHLLQHHQQQQELGGNSNGGCSVCTALLGAHKAARLEHRRRHASAATQESRRRGRQQGQGGGDGEDDSGGGASDRDGDLDDIDGGMGMYSAVGRAAAAAARLAGARAPVALSGGAGVTRQGVVNDVGVGAKEEGMADVALATVTRLSAQCMRAESDLAAMERKLAAVLNEREQLKEGFRAGARWMARRVLAAGMSPPSVRSRGPRPVCVARLSALHGTAWQCTPLSFT
jgi:hypothetical protein